jgi:hypothetical protein
MPNTIGAKDSCLSQGTVGQPDDEIPIVRRQLVDFQTELDRAERRVEHLENVLIAERNRVAQLENLLIAERNRVAQLELIVDALRNELRGITTSTSWRLTEPLRRLAALFPRFARLVRRLSRSYGGD